MPNGGFTNFEHYWTDLLLRSEFNEAKQCLKDLDLPKCTMHASRKLVRLGIAIQNSIKKETNALLKNYPGVYVYDEIDDCLTEYKAYCDFLRAAPLTKNNPRILQRLDRTTEGLAHDFDRYLMALEETDTDKVFTIAPGLI